MPLSRTVAALASDAMRKRLLVGVARTRQELHPIVVTEHAIAPDVPREITVVELVAGAEIPNGILCLPAHRRLKELSALGDEIRPGVVRRADDPGQLAFVHGGFAPATVVD